MKEADLLERLGTKLCSQCGEHPVVVARTTLKKFMLPIHVPAGQGLSISASLDVCSTCLSKPGSFTIYK